jgi:hypothetical protein
MKEIKILFESDDAQYGDWKQDDIGYIQAFELNDHGGALAVIANQRTKRIVTAKPNQYTIKGIDGLPF